MAENTINGSEKINSDAPEASKIAKQDVLTKPAEGATANFQEFDETLLSGNDISGEKLSLLKDLLLNVYIELGRTQMKVKDVLELERGYVIELDKLASEPVEIYANNKKIAEGEVVVIDKHFGIRITNLLEAKSRLEGI